MDLEFLDEALIALQGKLFFLLLSSFPPLSVVLLSFLLLCFLSLLPLFFPPICQSKHIMLCLFVFLSFSLSSFVLPSSLHLLFSVSQLLSLLLFLPLPKSCLCFTLSFILVNEDHFVALYVVRSIHVSGAPGGAEGRPQ